MLTVVHSLKCSCACESNSLARIILTSRPVVLFNRCYAAHGLHFSRCRYFGKSPAPHTINIKIYCTISVHSCNIRNTHSFNCLFRLPTQRWLYALNMELQANVSTIVPFWSVRKSIVGLRKCLCRWMARMAAASVMSVVFAIRKSKIAGWDLMIRKSFCPDKRARWEQFNHFVMTALHISSLLILNEDSNKCCFILYQFYSSFPAMHGVNVGLQTPDQDDCDQNEINFSMSFRCCQVKCNLITITVTHNQHHLRSKMFARHH